MNHLSRAAYALLFLLAPKPCTACSCEWPPGSPVEELASHDAVLAGRVVEIVEPADFTLGEYLQITFAVSSVWKGESQQMVSISKAADGTMCGYPFELGEQYLVYGYSSEEGLHTGLCSLRNNVLEAATEDIEQLGAPIATWPVDTSEDCCAVPEILGRWHTDSKEEFIDWPLLEFRSDGTCLANTTEAGVATVAEFSYAKSRTILFEDEVRNKVLFDTVRSVYRKHGDDWRAENLGHLPQLFFIIGHDSLTAYPYEHDWISRGVHYTRTNRPMLSITPDGRITSVQPSTWGEVKDERNSE